MCRIAHHHALSPRVTAEQPVAHRGFDFEKCFVARQFVIQPALRDERYREVVGAPDERDAVEKGIALRPLFHPLQTAAHMADKFLLRLRVISLCRQSVMAEVHERIPLIMTSRISSHPWRYRFHPTILKIGRAHV